ncbi:MAG: HAMP domain-containing histidine kinase [Leptolyngbyaceae cyanobacterium HOT.MB2.61]|nr:HAMP domain-containing histidine kinase [Leptolyngbyaceae cyanobacterium HOT.MB2.61]
MKTRHSKPLLLFSASPIYGNLSHANNYAQDLLRLLKRYQEHYPNPDPELQAEAEEIDLEFLVEDMPRLLASMKVGADRIKSIVSSLRNFSRMDESEVKAVNIHEGIDSTLMILQNRLKAKPDHPEIQIIKEYGDLPLVECYAGQMNQVFMNILTNALDAIEEVIADRQWGTTQGGYCELPTITIRTQAIDKDWVKIKIADNGPGIPIEVQKQLFEPFFTTKPIGKGTGLGLSISYDIVTEKHGGELQCFSSPGNGTEFVIEIPVSLGQKRISSGSHCG